jgi:uncharacterized membrane protein YqjE
MLTKVLQLLRTQPQLLADHAENYLLLIGAELRNEQARLRGVLVLAGVAVILGTGALVLSGTALMLWALHVQALWVLWLVPAGCSIALLVTLARLRTLLVPEPLAQVQAQLREDAALIRQLASDTHAR